MTPALHLRSYSGEGPLHAHPHVQVVLPVEGALEIEVAGRCMQLSSEIMAFIAPQERHCQEGRTGNRSLVLDVAAADLPEPTLDRLSHGLFLPMLPPVRRLVDFAGLSPDGTLPEATAEPLARLLVQALGRDAVPTDRFAGLERAIMAEPVADWTVDRMARVAGLSRSALYRALAEDRATTPARFVTAARLRLAQRSLLTGAPSLSRLAAELGFSDQAALTRAMRRETGRTPGDWRRLAGGTPGQ